MVAININRQSDCSDPKGLSPIIIFQHVGFEFISCSTEKDQRPFTLKPSSSETLALLAFHKLPLPTCFEKGSATSKSRKKTKPNRKGIGIEQIFLFGCHVVEFPAEPTDPSRGLSQFLAGLMFLISRPQWLNYSST